MPEIPPYFVTDRFGRKIRNPDNIAYMKAMHTKKNEEQEGDDNDRGDADGDDDDTDRDGTRSKPLDSSLISPPSSSSGSTTTDRRKIPRKFISAGGNRMILNPAYAQSVGTGRYVDLSKDFELADAENPKTLGSNPGARWIESSFGSMEEVRRVTVIQDGKLVADYRNEEVGPNDTHNLFSTTKGVMSMLIGMVVHQTDLKPEDTLEKIFANNPTAWSKIGDPKKLAYTKSVTIKELLTMTSGLVSMMGGYRGILTMKGITVADMPGSDLALSLHAPQYNPKNRGKFNYMPSSNILSYVIKEKTGLSPLEFAHKHVFPKLGILPDAMSWDANSDGIQTSYSQLKLTTYQMCKIGQLYLQDGHTSPNCPGVFGDDWIADSWTKQDWGRDFGHWYGYLWSLYDVDYHGQKLAGDCWCAPGFNGQIIATCRDTNRVVAISRTPFPPLDAEGLVHFKKNAIKLLGKTMSYHGIQLHALGQHVPPKFVRSARTGKMVRNTAYDEFMADLHTMSEGLEMRPGIRRRRSVRLHSHNPYI